MCRRGVGLAVARFLEGQELEGARDEALYASAKDLYDMRASSVSQQTQWSVIEQSLRAFAERSAARHGCTDLRLPS
jgi:hypothetical protein